MSEEKIERRFVNFTARAAGTDESPRIMGDAAVFDQETVIGEWFREMIAPGAFKRVLAEKPDTVCAFNHDWNYILGRTTAGTLRVEETEGGLYYEADVNLNDPQAVSVYEKVKRGDVSQASFAFTVRTEKWVNPSEKGGLALRVIEEVDQLYDVGPCTFGAYPQASAQARSKASEYQEQPQPAGQETGAVAEDEAQERDILGRQLHLLKLKIKA